MKMVTAIVDTTNTDEHMLDRAFKLAKDQHIPLHLHGLSRGYDSKSSDEYADQSVMDCNLSSVKHRASDIGIEVTTSKSYGRLWEQYLFILLKHQGDPTVLTSYPDKHKWQQWIPSNAIHKLMFDFPYDVIMVKEKEKWENNKALILLGPELVSYNSCGAPSAMEAMSHAVHCGKELESAGMDVYYICTYPDSLNFPEREKLLKLSSSPSSRMIIRWGTPEKVVPPIVDELNIDLLAVDIVKEKSMARQEGRYIRKLGQIVPCDIMAAHF